MGMELVKNIALEAGIKQYQSPIWVWNVTCPYQVIVDSWVSISYMGMELIEKPDTEEYYDWVSISYMGMEQQHLVVL